MPDNVDELKKLVAELRGQIKVKDNEIAALSLRLAKAVAGGGNRNERGLKTDKSGKFALQVAQPASEAEPVSVTDASPARPPPPRPAPSGEAKSSACTVQ